MFQVAKISFDAGALLLPANDPYEREVVFEQADFYARRHGAVGVQLGRAEFRVSCAVPEPAARCARCKNALRAVSFLIGARRFCCACAKHAAR